MREDLITIGMSIGIILVGIFGKGIHNWLFIAFGVVSIIAIIVNMIIRKRRKNVKHNLGNSN